MYSIPTSGIAIARQERAMEPGRSLPAVMCRDPQTDSRQQNARIEFHDVGREPAFHSTGQRPRDRQRLRLSSEGLERQKQEESLLVCLWGPLKYRGVRKPNTFLRPLS